MNSNIIHQLRSTALLLGSSLTIMAGAAISPALPRILTEFEGIENADFYVRLILTMPALFIALASPFVGILLDKWGRKPVLILSTTLYAISGSFAFFTDSIFLILLSRSILGVSVAGIMASTTTLIGDYFEGNQLTRMLGLQAAAMSFGGVLFLIIGGVLADIDWNYPFLIYASAFLLLPIMSLSLDEKVHSRKVVLSSKVQKLPIFKIGLIYLVAMLGMAIFYLSPVHVAFFLNTIEEIDGVTVGAIMAAQTLVTALISASFHNFYKKLHLMQIFVLLYFIEGLGFLFLSQSDSSFDVVLSITLIGFGFGLWIPSINMWLLPLVTPDTRGRIVGGLTFCFFLGQFLSPILSQPIISNFMLTTCFVVASVILFLQSVGFALMRNRHE